MSKASTIIYLDDSVAATILVDGLVIHVDGRAFHNSETKSIVFALEDILPATRVTDIVGTDGVSI